MNYKERMKEYLKEPDGYSSQYGKWGALNQEQRTLIKRLLNEMDNAETVIRDQFEEIERLNNKIDTLTIEISSLMSRYFYEKDFYIEDTHLDKLLRIINNDIELRESDKNLN